MGVGGQRRAPATLPRGEETRPMSITQGAG